MAPVHVQRPPHAVSNRRRSGFTLLELMVALGIGALAVMSIYALGVTTTREFQRQGQVASTQMALRVGYNLVKRDIARAGFLATPNARPPAGKPVQTCGGEDASLVSGTNAPLAAFSEFTDDPALVADTGLKPTGTANGPRFNADSIVLQGNYETTSEYAGIKVISSKEIAVPQAWHNFQRDFTNWYLDQGAAPQYQPTLFANAFANGRLIRIQTTRRLRHFAKVVRVTHPTTAGNAVIIEFDPALPPACEADANDGWVAPVSTIQLSVRDWQGGGSTRFQYGTGKVAQLMRRELDPEKKDGDGTLLEVDADANTNQRSLLDFVVAFHLGFTMTADTAVGAADNYTVGQLATVANVNDFPERIRSVRIELAARTALQDTQLAFDAARCAPLRCFQVFPRRGAARVRWLRGEVFVPNVAYEGY